MEKFLKILKINLLALLALPLLLIATVSKLTAKALEKVTVILGMLFFLILLILGFEFLKNPKGGLQVILTLIVIFIIGGLFIALLILMASVLVAVWNFFISIFDAVYNLTYSGFLHLNETCEMDYEYVNLNGKKIWNGFLCLFYSILRLVNRIIVTFVSLSLPLSFVLSGALVIGSLIHFHITLKATFGLTLIQYVQKFDLFSIIYGIVIYVAAMLMCITILLSLGTEWYEWAMELKMTNEEFALHIQSLQENEFRMAQDSQMETETGDAYMQCLQEHIDGLEALDRKMQAALAYKDNALLRSAWGNYFRNLSAIVDECSKYKQGIPLDKFKKLIPQIQQLEKQREEVKKLAEKLAEENKDPVKCSVFFSGCSNPEKLEKRYKSLCKAYHPDADGGDKETFQKMQEEYEFLKARMSAE